MNFVAGLFALIYSRLLRRDKGALAEEVAFSMYSYRCGLARQACERFPGLARSAKRLVGIDLCWLKDALAGPHLDPLNVLLFASQSDYPLNPPERSSLILDYGYLP